MGSERREKKTQQQVVIAGIGPGDPGGLTVKAAEAIRQARVLVGAGRMLAPYEDSGKKLIPEYRGERIAALLEQETEQRIAVLVSGDPGFYSAAASIAEALAAYSPVILPGISSLSCFCSAVGMQWQDVHVLSAHGRSISIASHVRRHRKTFVLTDGNISALLESLCRYGFGNLPVWVGERLSYPEERIVKGTAAELCSETWDRLAVFMVFNAQASEAVSFGLPDGRFVRGRVPMTKRPVRALTMSCLHPAPDSIVWDIGAGTGSVTVEAALAAWKGTVYAVERKPEGAELIRQNALRFGTDNVRVIEGTAPEALEQLPLPDCVFIGGSGGSLGAVLEHLTDRCVRAAHRFRLVMNAVSLETLVAAVPLLEKHAFGNVEYLQIQASDTKAAGSHHLLQGMNPVFIISGDFVPEDRASAGSPEERTEA